MESHGCFSHPVVPVVHFHGALGPLGELVDESESSSLRVVEALVEVLPVGQELNDSVDFVCVLSHRGVGQDSFFGGGPGVLAVFGVGVEQDLFSVCERVRE